MARGPRIFLGIADPVSLTDPGERRRPLIADDVVVRQLGDGWSEAFTDPDHERWAPYARGWLDHAAADTAHRNALLDVLINGGERSTEVLARLYAMARQTEFRDAISDLVLEKITIAQGVS